MAIYASPRLDIFIHISTVRITVAILAVLEREFKGNRFPARAAYGLFVTGDARDRQVSSLQGKICFLVLSNCEPGRHETFHGVALGAIPARTPLSKLSLMEIIMAIQTTSIS